MTDVIVREPRTYSADSPNSYFADVVRSTSTAWHGHHGAVARLVRHGQEVEAKLRDKPKSAEARRVQRELRNRDMQGVVETRSGVTSSTMAGFTTPQYLLNDYRLYRENPPSFLEQLNVQDIGEFGLQMNVPVFSGGAAVASQSEGYGVVEADPTTEYITESLSTYSGQVLVSQQLMDRAGPGATFDTFVFAQLMQEWEAAVDLSVINAALAGATSITRASAATPAIAGLMSDVLKARSDLETAAGVHLRPTHVFFDPEQWAYWASIVDSEGRPVLVPTPRQADMPMRAPVTDGDGDAHIPPAGFSGYALAGVPVFTDNSIPSASSDSQIIVMSASAVVPFVQKEPTLVAFDQTKANDLQVLVRLHGYATTLVLHPAGVAKISGGAYPDPQTFA